jgi:hypothetical protein
MIARMQYGDRVRLRREYDKVPPGAEGCIVGLIRTSDRVDFAVVFDGAPARIVVEADLEVLERAAELAGDAAQHEHGDPAQS